MPLLIPLSLSSSNSPPLVVYAILNFVGSVQYATICPKMSPMVCGFVLSRLYYCNSLLEDCPNQKLQKMLPYSLSEHPHPPTSLLCFILFTGYLLRRGLNTNCLLCFKIISHQAPVYLLDLLNLYSPSWRLCSSADTRVFRISSFCTTSSGQRSFSYQAPTASSQLPLSVLSNLP